MSEYVIVPAERVHIPLMVRHLRAQDLEEVTCLGLSPRRALRDSFKTSLFRRSAFVDGEIAAMWGVSGGIIDNFGVPWLLTTPAIERVPLAFIKEARREVFEIMETKQRIENYVLASYTRAIRFLMLMGFEIGEPARIGPDQTLFRRFWKEA